MLAGGIETARFKPDCCAARLNARANGAADSGRGSLMAAEMPHDTADTVHMQL
jgi:hypothetical protein